MNSWFEDNGSGIELKRDECYVRFKNYLEEDVHIKSVFKECQKVSTLLN